MILCSFGFNSGIFMSFVGSNLDICSGYTHFFGLPYQISIKESLLSREQVEDEMSEADFSEMAWDMEMGCLWYGDKDGSLFSYDNKLSLIEIWYGSPHIKYFLVSLTRFAQYAFAFSKDQWLLNQQLDIYISLFLSTKCLYSFLHKYFGVLGAVKNFLRTVLITFKSTILR